MSVNKSELWSTGRLLLVAADVDIVVSSLAREV
jgi:hypothetical protein